MTVDGFMIDFGMVDGAPQNEFSTTPIFGSNSDAVKDAVHYIAVVLSP